MHKKQIIFGMNNTIINIHAVPHWQKIINDENPRPYLCAKPLWNMNQLNAVLQQLKLQGWTIKVVTCLTTTGSRSFQFKVRRNKKGWLDSFGFPYDYLHCFQYGKSKVDFIRKTNPEIAILIDANNCVRKEWTLGKTIDPSKTDIIEELKALLV